MQPFIPGGELNRRYFRQAVAPVLSDRFPGLRYSAALLGPGSEVLGYDTETSQDHDWGPRAQLFLRPSDARRFRRPILRRLERDLPGTFGGFSTRFSTPDSVGVRVRAEQGEPLVWVGTISEFLSSYLHVDGARKLDPLDWTLLPQQKLLSIVRGPIYHDGIGLERIRSRFRYFPRDVWLHLLAVQWARIAEQEAFVGRADAVRDEVGARLTAARQVHEMIRLAFLLERTYFPYDKWLGTAFRALPVARRLLPMLSRALTATAPIAREQALSRAYELLARKQNALRLAPPLPARVSQYHERPYRVIHSGEFSREIRKRIRNPRIRALTETGSIDYWAATEEMDAPATRLRALRALVLSSEKGEDPAQRATT